MSDMVSVYPGGMAFLLPGNGWFNCVYVPNNLAWIIQDRTLVRRIQPTPGLCTEILWNNRNVCLFFPPWAMVHGFVFLWFSFLPAFLLQTVSHIPLGIYDRGGQESQSKEKWHHFPNRLIFHWETVLAALVICFRICCFTCYLRLKKIENWRWIREATGYMIRKVSGVWIGGWGAGKIREMRYQEGCFCFVATLMWHLCPAMGPICAVWSCKGASLVCNAYAYI